MVTTVKSYRPRFSVSFAGKDITAAITADIISLEYSDYIDGQSDEVSVELFNRNRKWCSTWYPEKGDNLQIGLGYENGDFVDYPMCELDTLEYGFLPDTVRLKGLTTGVSKSVRTRKGKLYTDTTLAAIAKEIAKRNKLAITGTILSIKIDKVSQYNERDLEFLLRLAKLYNHTFKIVGTKLVFSHKPEMGAQDAVRVIDYTEVTDLRLREKLKETVDTVDVAYQNPKTKKLQKKKFTKKSNKNKPKRKNGRTAKATASADTLKIIVRGTNAEETAKQAQAAISEANEDRCAGDFTVLGDPKLVAGNTIELTGVGELSGKYLINSSRHNFDRSSGYTTSCEIKRIYPTEEDELEEVTGSDGNE